MTHPIGQYPSPETRITTLLGNNALLRQELKLATDAKKRAFRNGAIFGAAVVALLNVALPAFADTVTLRGTTVTLEPADAPAVAVVTLNNLSVNDDRDNGVYPLAMDGLLVEVEFRWNRGIAGSDQIVVAVPDGFVCEPRDCTATVLEGEDGRVLLMQWVGM